MSKKLTQWLSENTQPVRIGVYEVRPFNDRDADNETRYAYWNGSLWSFWYSRIDSLIKNHMFDILRGRTHESLPWRGLAEMPA